MPISAKKWRKADETESVHGEIVAFLQNHPDKAFTVNEIAEELQPFRTTTETEKAIAALTFDLVLQALVWEGILERRETSTSSLVGQTKTENIYYRFSGHTRS